MAVIADRSRRSETASGNQMIADAGKIDLTIGVSGSTGRGGSPPGRPFCRVVLQAGPYLLALLVAAGCATTRLDRAVEPATPADLAVVTWNMNAGRGDLPRLASDLASGQLTGAPPANYVLLLQEAVSGVGIDASTLGKMRGLHVFVVPVREFDG